MSDESLRTVHVRWTSAGWTMIGLSVILMSTVAWQKEPVGLSVACALVMALAAARISARLALKKIRGEWLLPASPQAGREVSLGARLTAVKGAPPFTLEAWQPMSRRVESVVVAVGVEAQGAYHRWMACFPRRGLVTMPPLSATVTMPFGIVRAYGTVSSSATVLVLPNTGFVRRDLRERLSKWMDTGAQAQRLGDEEFSHVRDYRPGDPPRSVHWPASARHQRLLVSERHDPPSRRIALVIDTAAPKEFARFEDLISMAATLVDYLLSQQWTVSVHGAWLGPMGTEGDRHQLLAALALARIDTKPLIDFIPAGRPCMVMTIHPTEFPGWQPEPLIVSFADCCNLVRLRKNNGAS